MSNLLIVNKSVVDYGNDYIARMKSVLAEIRTSNIAKKSVRFSSNCEKISVNINILSGIFHTKDSFCIHIDTMNRILNIIESSISGVLYSDGVFNDYSDKGKKVSHMLKHGYTKTLKMRDFCYMSLERQK